MDDSVTPEYLERLRSGRFVLPEETDALLFNFHFKMVWAFEEPRFWSLTHDDALTTEPDDDWQPDDYAKHLDANYVTAEKSRAWFTTALAGMHELAALYNVDPHPLLWFQGYLLGETLSDGDKRAIRNCVSLLRIRHDARRQANPQAVATEVPGRSAEGNESPTLENEKIKPQWDDGAGRLYLDGVELIRVAKRATRMRPVLAAFEKVGWMSNIENPLRDHADPQALGQAVSDLNEKLPST